MASSLRHPIDIEALSNYLDRQLDKFIHLPIQIHQFEHGQSNPTYYLIDRENQKFVLRKKPPGDLISQKAHAIEREYQILSLLSQQPNFPCPKVYSLCMDSSIIGTPFYLMEFISGRIFHHADLPEISDRHERRLIYESAIDVLAQLHSIKPSEIGLDRYGSHQDFYDRQIRSLSKISRAQAMVANPGTGERVGEIERQSQLLEWYQARKPDHIITIIHGDYKVDNLVYHPNEPRVIAVLDWELSTLGHPYSDLANLLQPWYIPPLEDPHQASSALMGFRDVSLEHSPVPISASELLEGYCRLTGLEYPLKRWETAVSFSFFRLAVIAQGIKARVVQGQASSARAQEYADQFQAVGKLAIETIERFERSRSRLGS